MLHSKLIELSLDAVDQVGPPERESASSILAKHYKVETPGVGIDYWKPEETPYMIEPIDLITRRGQRLLIFVGPQRTGKSLALVNGIVVYKIRTDPVDMMVIRSSTSNANKWSKTELSRSFANNTWLKRKLGPLPRDDGVLMKRMRAGTALIVSWPSASELAEKTLGVVIGTDVDKWDGDVDGQGSGIEMSQKRTQTLRGDGVNVYESAPGSTWSDPSEEMPEGSHAFPATESGIKENICNWYNGGDRRWWYVRCIACGFFYPQNAFVERFEAGGTVCLHCGVIHGEETKDAENASGVWVPEGVTIDGRGRLSGNKRDSYPSYSLGGGAAKYQRREEIWAKLESARELMDRGQSRVYHSVVNSDIGGPARVIHQSRREVSNLLARKVDIGQRVVPEGVRFLVAAVDVQIWCFVVQVVGYGVDGRRWIIDRYNLSRSLALEDDGKTPKRVDPASRREDWHLLDKLLTKTYPLAGEGADGLDPAGRRMEVLATVCDSGGRKSDDGRGTVTANAYAYYTRLRMTPELAHLRSKFRLIKGASSRSAPTIVQAFPDTRARGGASSGMVPLLQIETTYFKDRLANDLAREDDGPGYVTFPGWLQDWWFKELTRETRGPTGWDSAKKNEAWDLMVYADAAAYWGPFYAIKKAPKGLPWVDWTRPPNWADEWDKNPLVYAANDPEAAPPAQKKRRYGY